MRFPECAAATASVAPVARRVGGLASLTLLVAALAACAPGAKLGLDGQSADPGTLSYPLAYVKKSIPSSTDDLRVLRNVLLTTNPANPGVGEEPIADVYVRAQADPNAAEVNVTTSITKGQPYDIKGLDVSYDGTTLVFAMRGPLAKNQKDVDPPYWRLYEYIFATGVVQPVIASDIVAGEGNDISPHFLPDGRILFSSTRQHESKAILLDEGQPQFEAQTEANTDLRNESTFNLHVMNADGTNIHQITFSQAHDRDPTVLVSGRILWSRWESPTGGVGINSDGIHLFTSNPDGTDVQLLYGAHSHLVGPAGNQPIEFVSSHEMPNGQILSLVRPFNGTNFGGDLYLIDTKDYVEQYDQAPANTVTVQTADPTSTLTGPAMTAATSNAVNILPGLSSGGRYSSAWPLWDNTNRILVSWTQCVASLAGATVACTPDVLSNPTATVGPPLYSVWMYDLTAQAFLPIVPPVEGVMITEAVIAVPRTVPGSTLPNTLIDQSEPTYDLTLANLGVGVVDIRSVYDIDGVQAVDIAKVMDPAQTTAAQRPARYVRIEKAVSIPPRTAGTGQTALKLDATAFGVTNRMEQILGYAPVEPDGSVVVEVPANVSFQITVLDANAERISTVPGADGRHHNWLQVMPGERLTCNGCHNPSTGNSHGRAGAFPPAYAGFTGVAGQPFPNTLTTVAGASSPTPQLPIAGETMAETRARVTCPSSVTPPDSPVPCSQIPSVNVNYTDYWTDPVAAGRPADASSSFSYSASVNPVSPSLTTLPPTSVACTSEWAAVCRITINYTEYIQPIWSAPGRLGPNGVGDGVCTDCHTPANAAMVGYLDLTNDANGATPTQLNSYVQLLEGSQHIINTPETETVTDPTTGVTTTETVIVPVTVTVPRVLSAGGAAASEASFFSLFAPGSGDPIHAGILYPSELRLIREWLDIGAQYFNNPFDPSAPLDN
jgi:hypothetical protein